MMFVLVPSLGISLFNIYFLKYHNNTAFSSPLWGFLYLIEEIVELLDKIATVLVPSLGISLFNVLLTSLCSCCEFVLVPSLGISLFNT